MGRERRTIEAMIRLYCRDRHGSREALCGECAELLEHARFRLEHCPFQEGKTVCAKCPIHCYRPQMREKVREVMRYSGPRMLTKHPLLAVCHLLDTRRRKPLRPTRGGRRR